MAPTQDVPIIAERLNGDAVERRLLIARWGLVPSWAKDLKIGSKLINARSESILDLASEIYRAEELIDRAGPLRLGRTSR